METTEEDILQAKLSKQPLEVLQGLKKGAVYKLTRFSRDFGQSFYQELIRLLSQSDNREELLTAIELFTEKDLDPKSVIYLNSSLNLAISKLSPQDQPGISETLLTLDEEMERMGDFAGKYKRDNLGDWAYEDREFFFSVKSLYIRSLIMQGNYQEAFRYAQKLHQIFLSRASLSFLAETTELILTLTPANELDQRLDWYEENFIRVDHSNEALRGHFASTVDGKIINALEAIEGRLDIESERAVQLSYGRLANALRIWNDPYIQEYSKKLFRDGPDELKFSLIKLHRVSDLEPFTVDERVITKAKETFIEEKKSILLQMSLILAERGVIGFNGDFIFALSELGVEEEELKSIITERIQVLLSQDNKKVKEMTPDERLDQATRLLEVPEVQSLFTRHRGVVLQSAFENPQYITLLDDIGEFIGLKEDLIVRQWSGGGF